MNHWINSKMSRHVWRDDMETARQEKGLKQKSIQKDLRKRTSRLEEALNMKSYWTCKLSAFLLVGLILKWAGRAQSNTAKPTSVSYVNQWKQIPASLPGKSIMHWYIVYFSMANSTLMLCRQVLIKTHRTDILITYATTGSLSPAYSTGRGRAYQSIKKSSEV